MLERCLRAPVKRTERMLLFFAGKPLFLTHTACTHKARGPWTVQLTMLLRVVTTSTADSFGGLDEIGMALLLWELWGIPQVLLRLDPKLDQPLHHISL